MESRIFIYLFFVMHRLIFMEGALLVSLYYLCLVVMFELGAPGVLPRDDLDKLQGVEFLSPLLCFSVHRRTLALSTTN